MRCDQHEEREKRPKVKETLIHMEFINIFDIKKQQ